jgi:GDP-4-dehydro-6-deoxy-D-mannose reductase
LHEVGDELVSLDADVDLGSGVDLEPVLSDARPDVIYHLAAQTNVARSWQEPKETYRVNVLGTLEILEAARALSPMPRVVLISSAEVYGKGAGIPLVEDAELRPLSPYASSKVAAEFLAVQEHLGRGLDIVRVRPFNHVGAGQSEAFVVSAFTKRVLEAERAGAREIPVGDLSAVRDFTDVRDVVRAYRAIAEHGVAGAVYNVCSGVGRSIEELLTCLLEIADADIRPRIDESLLRPVELPYLVGDSTRVQALTGWKPEIEFRETLRAVLEDWRARLS